MDDQTTQKGSDFDIRRYVRMVRDSLWLMLAGAVVVGGAVTLWTLRQDKVYEATCTIEHDPTPPRPLGGDVEDVADPIGSYWASREYYETQNRILNSRSIAERVVERLGLHESPEFMGVPSAGFEPATVVGAGAILRAKININPVDGTRLVRIEVRDNDPERARILADAIAEEYIDKQLEDRMSSTVTALAWLSEQLDSLRTELDDAELALHSFKQEHNVLSVSLEDRQNLISSEIVSFNSALTNVRQQRIAANARAVRVQEMASHDLMAAAQLLDADVYRTATEVRSDLADKIAERQSLGTRYGENHPEMKALATQIEQLKANLRTEIDGVVQNARANLAEIRRIEGGLVDALDAAHADGLELNLREIEFNHLNRDRENKTKLYELVLERTTETNLTRMLRTAHVRIADRALKPAAPVKPNVAVNVTGGILGGLLLGLALGFGLRFLDRRIRDTEQVEELGVSVLGILPTIDERSRAEGGKRGGSSSEDPVRPVNRDLTVHNETMSAAAECARTIRTNLTFMSATSEIRSFVVTSASPREGKTTVACSLAIALAQSGKRVLLVDSDMRRPRLHKSFGITGEEGISSLIVGNTTLEEAAASTVVEGLHLLPCGPVPPNPSELLHSAAFRRFLEEALERYDRVIFDSPPLGAVTDAAVLAPQLDGVVLVVKARSTTRDAMRSTIRQISDVGARILGAVLNSVNLNEAGYGSEGYYHYYRKHGYYAESEDGAAEVDSAA